MPWQKHGLMNFTEETNRRKEPGQGKDEMPVLETSHVKILHLNSHFDNLGVWIWIVRLSAMPKGVKREQKYREKEVRNILDQHYVCVITPLWKFFLKSSNWPLLSPKDTSSVTQNQPVFASYQAQPTGLVFFKFIFKIISRCSKAGENSPPVISTFSHLSQPPWSAPFPEA